MNHSICHKAVISHSVRTYFLWIKIYRYQHFIITQILSFINAMHKFESHYIEPIVIEND